MEEANRITGQYSGIIEQRKEAGACCRRSYPKTLNEDGKVPPRANREGACACGGRRVRTCLLVVVASCVMEAANEERAHVHALQLSHTGACAGALHQKYLFAAVWVLFM